MIVGRYGHPREDLLGMLEYAVTGTRAPGHVRAGSAPKTFEDFTVDRAIYATGWDGNVVLDAGADGVLRVQQQERAVAAVAR